MSRKEKVTVKEFNDLIDNFKKIYKTNFDIVYNFFIEKYDLKNSVIYKFILDGDYSTILALKLYEINEEVLVESKDFVYINSTGFSNDIFKSNNKQVINAFINLNDMRKITYNFSVEYDKHRDFSGIGIEFCLLEHVYRDIKLKSTNDKICIKQQSVIQYNELNIIDKEQILKMPEDTILKIKDYNLVKFNRFKNYINYYKQNNKNDLLFDDDGKLHKNLRGVSLFDYDLKKVNFDGKNISGIDISCNPEANINFDKIVKDLSDANIKGYNLNKYKFVGFDLTNTNLCDTYATIDLATCNINYETKMSPGTLFDSNNKFTFWDKELTHDEARKLGIKVLRKENR